MPTARVVSLRQRSNSTFSIRCILALFHTCSESRTEAFHLAAVSNSLLTINPNTSSPVVIYFNYKTNMLHLLH
jgi:hypothetical protein